jgi:hypothetical protein
MVGFPDVGLLVAERQGYPACRPQTHSRSGE